jgi:hypothetical protein
LKRKAVIVVPVLLLSQISADQDALIRAAARYVPGVNWLPKSVVVGDFTCGGRKQQAVLGTNSTDIVVAVFINGTAVRPEVLRYSTKVRNPASATLEAEGLDYDPKEDPGYELPGFQRSKSCKGLNLSDGEIDSAHIYWNHQSRKFADWIR